MKCAIYLSILCTFVGCSQGTRISGTVRFDDGTPITQGSVVFDSSSGNGHFVGSSRWQFRRRRCETSEIPIHCKRQNRYCEFQDGWGIGESLLYRILIVDAVLGCFGFNDTDVTAVDFQNIIGHQSDRIAFASSPQKWGT